MESEKYEFRRNAESEEPDIAIELHRVQKKQIDQWTPAERRMAADWLKQVERAFNRFKSDILSA